MEENIAEDSARRRSEILLQKEELKLIIENHDISLPIIHKRLQERKSERYLPSPPLRSPVRSLSVYFLLLQEIGNNESIPYLVSYLCSLPDEEKEVVSASWHPFIYAITAIKKITGSDIPVQDMESLFSRRKDIANAAMQWYEEHKQ